MCALITAWQDPRRRSTGAPRLTEPLSSAQEGYCLLVAAGDNVSGGQKVWQLGDMGGSRKEEGRLDQQWLLGDRKRLMIGEREKKKRGEAAV